jgi:hypothetical protein
MHGLGQLGQRLDRERCGLCPAMRIQLGPKSGASDWADSSQPPSSMGATSAATSINMPSTGASAGSACSTAAAVACVGHARRCRRPPRARCCSAVAPTPPSKCPPMRFRRRRWPTPRPRPPLSSDERDELPRPRDLAFLTLAFSRRRGDAGSVFSRSLSSAIHAPLREAQRAPCLQNYWGEGVELIGETGHVTGCSLGIRGARYRSP